MATVSQKQAVKLVAKLTKPAGMYKPSWKRLVKILKALCGYLPDPYPGMRRLSADTKIPLPTVARLLDQAEKLGLIARIERAIPGHRDGYTYRLTCLDSFSDSYVSVSDQTETEEELRSSPPTEEKISGRRMGGAAARKRNRWTGPCCVCSFPVQPREGFLHGCLPVHIFCDTGYCDSEKLREYVMDKRWQQEQAQDWAVTAFGEDPEAPLPVKEVRKSSPGAQLAYQFEALWYEHVLKLVPEFRQHRCINLGPAIGYLNSQFLAKGYSPEHVLVYFEEFFDTLCDPNGNLALKEGQTPWQLFTGWWGTTEIPDPAIERRRKERLNQMIGAIKEQRVKDGIERAAAWERIEAAQARGEKPDDLDIVLATGSSYVAQVMASKAN